MKRILLVGLVALAGCSGGSGAVGENSADSIRTEAVGNVVATIPSPTPTPEVDGNTAPIATTAEPNATSNALSAEADNMAADGH